jgi:diguanylate cyclase (GGDEF)-like protein
MDIKKRFHYTTTTELELGNFNRTLAEIEWLLLILILVFLFMPGSVATDYLPIITACAAFAGFVLLFRYLNLLTESTRWKLAIETWVMIALIAYVTWHSGGMHSPLFNLYLLVIIFSALTLGKVTTLLEVALITAFYLFLAEQEMGTALYGYEVFGAVMIRFAPFLLVAYITALLASDMIHTREIMRQLSETDELTGVLNMRAFAGRLQQALEDAEREDSTFVVMMIDADNLKPINDEHGHEVGNQLIKSVVHGIHEGLRSSDIIARYGGDEFVALLSSANEQAAREAAERIRSAVENTSFDVNGSRISTTVSIGFSVYPDMGVTSDKLLSRADRALYVGKQSGRNRVVSFSDIADVDLPEEEATTS